MKNRKLAGTWLWFDPSWLLLACCILQNATKVARWRPMGTRRLERSLLPQKACQMRPTCPLKAFVFLVQDGGSCCIC